jgi:small subunit ribosomal protein S8
MSMQDPIADMFVRIKNSQAVNKTEVSMPSSNIKVAISKVLQDEGYIKGFDVSGDSKPVLTVQLKYYQGSPVIEMLKRISRPGLKTYCSKEDLPQVNGGLGVAVMSTSKGVMTAQKAAEHGVGGEVLCYVY